MKLLMKILKFDELLECNENFYQKNKIEIGFEIF